jgi:hypothetical protein
VSERRTVSIGLTDYADTHGQIFKKSMFDREICVQILMARDEIWPNWGKNKLSGLGLTPQKADTMPRDKAHLLAENKIGSGDTIVIRFSVR